MRKDVVQEGLANVCLVGSSTTVQKAKIESSIPRKRGAAAAGYDKALQSFCNKVTSAPQRQWVQTCGICTALIYPPCETPQSSGCEAFVSVISAGGMIDLYMYEDRRAATPLKRDMRSHFHMLST